MPKLTQKQLNDIAIDDKIATQRAERLAATPGKPAPTKPARKPNKPATPPTAAEAAHLNLAADGLDPAITAAETFNIEAAYAVNRRVNYTAHDAATIADMRYPAATISNRDDAYIAFFGKCAGGESGVSVSLASIAAQYKRNPFYAGSAKSTDAGAIQRAVKHGYLTIDDDARAISLTERGADYSATRLRVLHGFSPS